MSFYNADPRAYFNIYANVTWDSVWGKQEESPSENLTWKDIINNYEIGRLVRIKNGESKSSADYNNQIFVVEYGKNDIIYDKENNTSVEQSEHKYLKPLDLTNPYSIAVGEGLTDTYDDNGTLKGVNNLTIVGQYNETPTSNDKFIVGNGTNENNKNSAIKVATTGIYVKDSITIKDSSNNTKFNIDNQSGNIISQGYIQLQEGSSPKIKLNPNDGNITANGSLQSDSGQLILTPVASSSSITPITGKKILNIRTVNNTDTIYIDNLAYAPQTITVTSDVKVHNSEENGIEIAKLQSSQGADIPNGKIQLPSTIAQDTIIGAENSSSNNNLTVKGITTALGGVKTNSIQPKDGTTITIPSGNTLKTDIITSTTPTGNGATNLSLNTTGNTKIGNTNSGITSGFIYGNYPIKIIANSSSLPSSQDGIIYIVLNDT